LALLCKKSLMTKIGAFLAFLGLSLSLFSQSLPVVKTFQHFTLDFNNEAVYAHAYEQSSHRVFICQRGSNRLLVFDISDLTKVRLVKSVSLATNGNKPNDVAVMGNTVAVITQNSLPQAQGKVAFFDTNANFLNQLSVGAQPKSITFGNGSNQLLIANEGAPSDDYTIDPIGSISIVNLFGANPAMLTQANVAQIDFTLLDTVAFNDNVRIFNNANQLPSVDLEPEQIIALSGGSQALVSLSENNALAIIDYATNTIDTVIGLGLKNFNLPNQGFDGSNLGAIKIDRQQRVFGLYNPAGIAAFTKAGSGYWLTTNQGTPRNYSAYSEVEVFKNLPLGASGFPNRSVQIRDSIIGQLEVSKELGKARNGFVHDSAVAFGGRSFSVWNNTGQLIWDSGDEIEQTLATLQAANFNANSFSNQSRKASSPAQGAQPNAIAIGTVDGVRYAFITLKEMGGILIYNLNNPSAPVFEQYLLDRDFNQPANDTAAGDLGPTKITFTPAGQSPNGIALLMVSSAVSGSFTIYQMGAGIGLPETKLNPNTAVWPNPSQGIFYTNSQEPLKIYNQQGQLVKETSGGESIDLSAAPAGFYLIQTAQGRALKVIKR
jgi:hypothetical protein